MPSSTPALLLDLDLHPGATPVVRAERTGDEPGWAVEHGAVLVRGLGVSDAREVLVALVDPTTVAAG